MGVKIYTKTGDKGETSLFGGKRIVKYALRVEAYGTVDEVNSVIGGALSYGMEVGNSIKIVVEELEKIQHDLFTIGSVLATPAAKDSEERVTNLKKRIAELEECIDHLTEQLPDLRNFILPGGSSMGASLHVARTVCRRAERRIVELSHQEIVFATLIIYMNRLSDVLFTMARFVNRIANKKEIIWQQ